MRLSITNPAGDTRNHEYTDTRIGLDTAMLACGDYINSIEWENISSTSGYAFRRDYSKVTYINTPNGLHVLRIIL